MPISRMWLFAMRMWFGNVAAVPKIVSVEPSVAIALSPMWTNSLCVIEESVTSFENTTPLPPVWLNTQSLMLTFDASWTKKAAPRWIDLPER
jgi:hypothetical protein